jgi:hypothetical protein
VLVQVQRTPLEEGEQAEVDFHPHCHHLKKKPDHKKEQTPNMSRRQEEGQRRNNRRIRLAGQEIFIKFNISSNNNFITM